uniref:Ig-like domain-containing protein n=1 Tax=Cyprinus carpio TaxID=7962 RepID=A0A8C1LUV7_CYPCA
METQVTLFLIVSYLKLIKTRILVQTAVEGETVTINCTYSTTDSFPYLFWYQQEINGYPRYMLKKFPGSGEVDKQFEGRFDAKLNTSRTSVPLTIKKISSAKVTDSALYYCALTPTVTGNTKPLYKNLTHLRRQICL